MARPIDIIVKSYPTDHPFRIAAENRNSLNNKYCPQCKKYYEPNAPSYEEAITSDDREQWISGICSDECWCNFLGLRK